MDAKSCQTVDSVPLEDLGTVLFPKIKDPKTIATIIARTQSWTADNLFLTQLIYQYIRQYSAQIIQTEGANNIVDEIVHQKIIKNWRTNEAASLLCRIENTLHAFKCQDTLIVLYLQILWRQGIAVNSQAKLQAEKTTLIQSGLITLAHNQLQLSNRIYATVFDISWIEQQLPGLTTRTVSTPATTAESAPSEEPASPTLKFANKISWMQTNQAASSVPTPTTSARSVSTAAATSAAKVASTLSTAILMIGGVTLLGFAAIAYFKAPNNLGAAAYTLSPHSSQQPVTAATSQDNDPKAFFDQGMVHAANGRWLPMIQQFCNIPSTSAYFPPANSQVASWVSLYPQDIQRANNTLLTTRNTPCAMIENALQSVK